MDNQYKLLSELLSDQAAFITYQKQVWQIIGGHCPPAPPAPLPPVSTGLYNVIVRHITKVGILIVEMSLKECYLQNSIVHDIINMPFQLFIRNFSCFAYVINFFLLQLAIAIAIQVPVFTTKQSPKLD